MNNYTYTVVNTKENTKLDEELPRKMLFHQIFICSGIWTCFFLYGVSLGSPTVFIPQIRREANSTEAVSTEMASWLNAVLAFGAIPWIFILPVFISYFGRVLPYRLVSLIALAGVAVFYFSTNVVQILISEVMMSSIGAAQMTLFIIILAEYTSPEYRGVFLTMKSASLYWGIWVSNAIGTFFHWKNIVIVQLVCSAYIIVSAIVLPESPYWLANKGRIEAGTTSLRWLKGFTEAADKELKSIIHTRKEIINTNKESHFKIRNFYEAVTSKEIYKPILCCMLMTNLYYSTGKLVCTMYAIDIIKKISSKESVAYTVMLILDGITVLSMYIGCGISKKLKRRTLLMATTSLGTSFLLILSVYLYLVKFSVLQENNYLSAGLLIGFSISISCGPMILTSSITSEMLPLKFRSTIACITASYDRAIMGVSLKISPAIFIYFGTHGAFLFFAILTSFFLTITYYYLPETKDKTLTEITFLMDSKIEERELCTLNDREITEKNRI